MQWYDSEGFKTSEYEMQNNMVLTYTINTNHIQVETQIKLINYNLKWIHFEVQITLEFKKINFILTSRNLDA